MVLADTRLEHFLKPVGVGIILEVVATILAHLVAAWECSARVGTSLTDIVAILLSVHNVVCATWYNVGTKVARVVHLERLVLLTILCCDDNHTVCCTRTINSTSRSILKNLDSFNIVRREVAYGGTHWHTVDNIKRICATERTDTTNTYLWVGTRLTVGCNLYTGNLTLKHCRDV